MFTTNYDRCLEAFWREDAEIELFTGFEKVDESPTPILNPDSLQSAPNRVQLVKLHGSSTWLRNKVTGNIIEEKFDIDQASHFGVSKRYDQEVAIYPLSEKALYLEPYLEMFECLNKELHRQDVWIVIGYSFRDSVIRNIFQTHLEPKKRLILIDPDAYNIVSKRFPYNRAHIVQLAKRFGEKDGFQSVNDQVVQALSLIRN